jgi:peptide-methionine (S)-S-oxide reductase
LNLFGLSSAKLRLPAPGTALPGRAEPIATADVHRVFETPLDGPFPAGSEVAIFALGCFWGAERLFWRLPGVVSTAAGYAGGETPNPTYDEVCSGGTGHAEVVRVVFDPTVVGYGDLLRVFFEAHDPTQGMRQGNDVGTQYRSAIYTIGTAQAEAAAAFRDAYDARLARVGFEPITTEIRAAPPFYFAEAWHQQYLDAHPNGYCGLRGTGVACPIGGGERP